MSTGLWHLRMTRSVALPKTASLNPPRPRFAMTTKPAFVSLATSQITSPIELNDMVDAVTSYRQRVP